MLSMWRALAGHPLQCTHSVTYLAIPSQDTWSISYALFKFWIMIARMWELASSKSIMNSESALYDFWVWQCPVGVKVRRERWESLRLAWTHKGDAHFPLKFLRIFMKLQKKFKKSRVGLWEMNASPLNVWEYFWKFWKRTSKIPYFINPFQIFRFSQKVGTRNFAPVGSAVNI